MVLIHHASKRLASALRNAYSPLFRAMATISSRSFVSKGCIANRPYTPHVLGSSFRIVRSVASMSSPRMMPAADRAELNEESSLFGSRPDSWYTACPPVYGQCPGVHADGKIYSVCCICVCRAQQFFNAASIL